MMSYIYYLDIFNEYQTGRGLKDETISRNNLELKRFFEYLKGLNIADIKDVSKKDIEEYYSYLIKKGFSESTKQTAVRTIKALFTYLHEIDLILTNPFDRIEIIFKRDGGLRSTLTEKEMFKLLDAIQTHTGKGVRDRAFFELLYYSGLRLGEAVRLEIEDVDFSLNEIFIRSSKFRKERIVPLGSVSKRYLQDWINRVRSWYLTDSTNLVFLSKQGKKLTCSTVNRILKRYLNKAGIERAGVCVHSIRHSCASHLLEHGAEIRYVQSLLGHESIETTAGYTRGIVESLRKMYKMHHPRENELYRE
ncbi:MAG: tyrosine-type recombinase/integrase [Spirochaetes bacterium]|nr:tyrosine-type recombinase/integrase [Spirochaetota bacterium]